MLSILCVRSKSVMSENSANEKLLKSLQAASTFLLGYLFFEGFIEKLLKSTIKLVVKLLPTNGLNQSFTIVNSVECYKESYYGPSNAALIVEITSGLLLTLLVLTSLVSVWKKKSKVITVASVMLFLYCLITSVHLAILNTIRYHRDIDSSEKYYSILDGAAFVLFEVICALCLFVLSKKVKLLNKSIKT